MKIHFSTAIDKYQNKFPDNFKHIPRVGEYVYVEHEDKNLPFQRLQVCNVTHISADLVVVELHLSDLQIREAKQYKLNVYG